MAQQAIFIGIGGAGVTTVAHIKAKLLADPEYNGKLEALYENNHFIFLDTDEKARKELNSDPKLCSIFKNDLPINNNEYLNLGATKPFMIYHSATTRNDDESKRLLEWIHNDIIGGLPTNQLQSGAGAQRIAGRTAVYDNWDEIIRKINAGINKMNAYDQVIASKDQDQINKALEASKPAIWVFASSNGGTGSSAILDVLYIADRVFQAKFKTDPFLRLVLFMPNPFIESNDNNIVYSLNAFSTFWELNTFRYDAINKKDGNKFKYFSCKPDKDKWDTIPGGWKGYSYLIPVDAETDNNKPIPIDNLFINTAEMCYYLHKSAVGDVAISRLDNDVKDPKLLNEPRTDTNTGFAWTKSLVAIGYKAICKPDEYLRRYVKSRFMYEIFDYGLLGYAFSEIIKNENHKSIAIKNFADKYIFNLLLNTEDFEASDTSLQKVYYDEFNKIKFPIFEETPKKEEWELIWTSLKPQISATVEYLSSEFISPGKEYSKDLFIKEINKSVNEGVNESIRNFGLHYTKELLSYVDDKYCEKLIGLLDYEMPSEADISIKENQIVNIINTGKRKNDLPALHEAVNKYKNAVKTKILFKNVKEILVALTVIEKGELEILYKGDNYHNGLTRIISDVEAIRNIYSDNYRTLSKEFKATKDDLFTTYFPSVHEFVGDSSVWVDNHEFERLYADVVTLDVKGESARKGTKDFGFPPLRGRIDNSEKSLFTALGSIIGYLKSDFFTTIALNDFSNNDADYQLDKFVRQAEFYIEGCFAKDNKVKNWLADSIEVTFKKMYPATSEGEKRKAQFKDEFIKSVPVLYPRRDGGVKPKFIRTLFAGSDPSFAKQFGYDDTDKSMQFKHEKTLTNRFLYFKIEVGHNLYDYHGFDNVANVYMKNRQEILNLNYGCHIHKDFAKLDLDEIVGAKKSSPFTDFIKLTLYDTFFKLLATSEKNLCDAIFGKSKTEEDIFSENPIKGGYKPFIIVENKENTMILKISPFVVEEKQIKDLNKITISIDNISNLTDLEKKLTNGFAEVNFNPSKFLDEYKKVSQMVSSVKGTLNQKLIEYYSRIIGKADNLFLASIITSANDYLDSDKNLKKDINLAVKAFKESDKF
jgi:hypothetical protein